MLTGLVAVEKFVRLCHRETQAGERTSSPAAAAGETEYLEKP
jgi:hypothetical protein